MVLGAGKELAGAVRSANRAVVEWLDRSPASLVLVAGFSAGAAWGVFARFWMRFITTHEEFSWSGTTFIVVAFGVAIVGQAGMYLARRSQMTRRGFIGLRIVAVATLVPLATGAGAFAFPLIILSPLAAIRTGWNRWLRVVLGVAALMVATGVAVTFFSDLGLARAVVGTIWFVLIYAVLAWAVCFSFAAQDDQRFGDRSIIREVTPTPSSA